MAEPKKKSYLADAWLVLLLAVVFGVALAGVHLGLRDTIDDNKLGEAMKRIPSLVPGAVKGKLDETTGKGEGKRYLALDESGKQVGVVLQGKGPGYADIIEVLIGVNAEGTLITGLYVLECKETPNLGDKIKGEAFLGEFAAAKKLDTSRPVVAVKSVPKDKANEIQAISGATVSSKSVCEIVNKTVAKYRESLESK